MHSLSSTTNLAWKHNGNNSTFVKAQVSETSKLRLSDIVGFKGSISPDIQQYSSQVFLLNEHYSEICDNRDDKPYDTIDEVVDDSVME